VFPEVFSVSKQMLKWFGHFHFLTVSLNGMQVNKTAVLLPFACAAGGYLGKPLQGILPLVIWILLVL
jgi:hypothetical protein